MNLSKRQQLIEKVKNKIRPIVLEQMEEGGLGGHMAHLHEDQGLTFGELKAIFHQASKGKLESVTEKLDGQNIFFTFSPTEGLRFARNTAHIKTNGIGADEIESRWADKPAVAAAFGKAFKVLSASIASLPQADRQQIFNDGKIWYSAEIVGTLNPNVINYDQDAVVFHESGAVYDENGQPLNVDTSAAFAKLVSSVNRMQTAIKDSGWKVLGPVMVPLQKLSNNEPLEVAVSALNEVMNKYGMSNDNTLAEMFEEYIISDKLKDIVADDDTKSYIAELASDFDNTITSKKPILADLVNEGLIQKEDLKKISSIIKDGLVLYTAFVDPVREIVTEFAVDVLKAVQSYLIINPNEEIQRLRDEVQKAISTIQQTGTEHSNQVLEKELGRLHNLDNITSSMEGIVFKYNGKLYKLTGAFAPVNQILGIAKYGR
jgi:hypothetical protein